MALSCPAQHMREWMGEGKCLRMEMRPESWLAKSSTSSTADMDTNG